MITVVAALIKREGKLLACQRRQDAAFPLKWEFPGGKLQPGETPAEALARELHEELGVTISVGREVYRTRHHYAEPPGELELIFFAATLADGVSPRNLAFQTMEWVSPERLRDYDFLPADRELTEKVASGELFLQGRGSTP